MDGKYSAEPYFLAADVYYGDNLTGHSGWSGYTGSAAWFYRVAMKYYLGIELCDGAVVITPHADIAFTVPVRIGGCKVIINVCGEGTERDESADAEYHVREGESVTIKPIGEKMNVYIEIMK